jgi:hypothetical protein
MAKIVSLHSIDAVLIKSRFRYKLKIFLPDIFKKKLTLK